jgi:hypothetical protein
LELGLWTQLAIGNRKSAMVFLPWGFSKQDLECPRHFLDCYPMKQCPQCRRDYSDDLNFCLEDGAALKPKQDDDKTWVMPEPAPTIAAVGAQVEPGPTVAAPPPQRSQTRKVLATIGIIFGVGLYALIKIAPWSDRLNGPTAQNTNDAPISSNFAPSASPTVSTTAAIAPSPSPSPTSSPTDSPTVSPTPVQSSGPSIVPGVYATKFQPNNRPEDALGLRTVRLVFTFKSDGYYTIQGYVTVRGTDLDDRLYQDESGKYTQTNDRLRFYERISRHFDFDSGTWTQWAVPSSGSSASDSIRNVTPTSFDFYADGAWLFMRRMY